VETMRTGGCIITVLYFLHFSVNLLKSKVCSFCHICNFSPLMTKNNNQENNLVKSKMSYFISRRMRTYTFTGTDVKFRCPDRLTPHQTIYGAKNVSTMWAAAFRGTVPHRLNIRRFTGKKIAHKLGWNRPTTFR
jgi:hypothetical protein